MPAQRNKRSAKGTQQDFLAEDHARLQSWVLDIAAALLNAAWRDEGPERVYTQSGGLSINRERGCWYRHARGIGSYSAVSLIQHLQQCDRGAAIEWARLFLAAHPGTGSCGTIDEDGDDEEIESSTAAAVSAARGQAFLDRAQAIDGTAGETYLRRRGLLPPYPGWLRFVPDARAGDDALLGELEANGRVVALQLTFLAGDQTGAKSLALPQRRKFLLDKQAGRDGVFIHAPNVPAATLATRPTLICEGAEDLLALAAAFPDHRIVGLPGIGSLQRVPAKRGESFIVCRDGDTPDSPADHALQKGLDHLLLQEAGVTVTAPDEASDNNDILLSGGVDALRSLVAAALPATLSIEGEIQKICRLPRMEFEKQRKEAAKQFGIRVAVLDAMRAEMSINEDDAADDIANALIRRMPQPWAEPVRLGDVLTEFEALIKKHHGCSEHQRVLVAIWAAHTYAYWHFQFTPRLALSSPHPGCGKTTLMNILALTCFKPIDCDSITAANLRRIKAITGWAVLLLDEISEQIAASDELDTVLRSGFEIGKRSMRLVVDSAGNYTPASFEVDLACAVSGLTAVAGALSSRSIHLVLQPKADEVELTKLREPGCKEALMQIGDKLARWAEDSADDLERLPPVPKELNALNDRQVDFSLPLLSIAAQAGGQWPERLHHALQAVLIENRDLAETPSQQLHADIVTLFTTRWSGLNEVNSNEIVRGLHALTDSPWNGGNGKPPLTTYGLAKLLRPYAIRPGDIGPANNRTHGYSRYQFFPQDPDKSSHPSQSSQKPENPSESASPSSEGKSSHQNQSSQPKTGGNPDDASAARSARSSGSSKEKEEASAPLTNGADPEADPAHVAFLNELRALRQAHPARKRDWLAKQLKQPLWKVAAGLDEIEPPP